MPGLTVPTDVEQGKLVRVLPAPAAFHFVANMRKRAIPPAVPTPARIFKVTETG